MSDLFKPRTVEAAAQLARDLQDHGICIANEQGERIDPATVRLDGAGASRTMARRPTAH
jgi:hypothetical protein